MEIYRPRELAAIDVCWNVDVRIPLDAYRTGLVARATFVLTLCADKGDPDRRTMAEDITRRGIEEGELSAWHSGAEDVTEAQVVAWIMERGVIESDIQSMTIDRVMFADEIIASARIY